MKIEFNVDSVTVLLRNGCNDIITIIPKLPPTLNTSDTTTRMTIEASKNTGEQWIKDNLHIDPQVIDAR